MLLFEFDCLELDLLLVVGPGPKKTRERLFNLAQRNKKIFRNSDEPLNRDYEWPVVFRTEFFPKYGAAEDSATEGRIQEKWANFVKNDLPALKNSIKSEKKFWET